jgi:hypothetical protein
MIVVSRASGLPNLGTIERMPIYLVIPIAVLGTLLVLLGVLIFLGRFRKGKYLRPLLTTLMKVKFLRRWFQKASTAALERQNPELASAMRKLQPHAKHMHDPQQAQKAMSRLTREERAAVLEMQDQQGAVPEEATNRQMRRRLEKQRRDAQRRGR